MNSFAGLLSETYEAAHGRRVSVVAGVERVTAPNAGPMTYKGTNTYIIGQETVCIIDPGPADEAHFHALQLALRGRTVSHILVTHTHRDHSGLAMRLKAATGAMLVAEGPHRLARALHPGEDPAFGESGDRAFQPDILLADGDLVQGEGFALEAVLTPGHAANHAAFALKDTGLLFSGDHVMGWASTVIAPPDGSMRDYMASLDRLLAREDLAYLPGHGGAVANPAAYVRGLKTHRQMRAKAILARVRAGDRDIETMVRAMYRGIETPLFKAACLSVLAHLEDLVAQGEVLCDGPVLTTSLFSPG
ncbi:MBL fold metallo-hydrolase [Allorhizobium sp. BGMRC 0089]|uniref:MBL fold metallo-hydrolase n=1 Tax=Allorhizobium sonneratiae TaxID=2934936 RepID=UPI002033CE8E|nr:MBL fold metallo-hydrolase [Allorhizobium sonneratiae]MCM2291814.1 MBL fold metallo-hydrolase [Allorhizobium sonneratiae]